MNRKKTFDPHGGQILAIHGEAQAVFVWTGFVDPVHIERVLTAVREYVRNSCTGRFITGDCLVEPLPHFRDEEVEDFAARRAAEGNLDFRTTAALARSKLNY